MMIPGNGYHLICLFLSLQCVTDNALTNNGDEKKFLLYQGHQNIIMSHCLLIGTVQMGAFEISSNTFYQCP